MHILVVGGARHIGSHMVRCLVNANIEVTSLDNLSSDRRELVTHGEFVKGDIGDRAQLDQLFGRASFDGVVHFAAHIDVGESVADSSRARTELGWIPQHADLATIVEHAWQWEQVLSNE